MRPRKSVKLRLKQNVSTDHFGQQERETISYVKQHLNFEADMIGSWTACKQADLALSWHNSSHVLLNKGSPLSSLEDFSVQSMILPTQFFGIILRDDCIQTFNRFHIFSDCWTAVFFKCWSQKNEIIWLKFVNAFSISKRLRLFDNFFLSHYSHLILRNLSSNLYAHHLKSNLIIIATIIVCFSIFVYWFFDVAIMKYRKIDFEIKFISLTLFDIHWKSNIIAIKKHCHRSTIYRWKNCQKMYEKSHLSTRFISSRSRILTIYIKNIMIEFKKQRFWTYHDELKIFLNEKWKIKINVFTICKTLKEKNINRKKKQRFSNKQNDQLRVAWQTNMLDFIAKQLIVIDEIIFKAQTSWRCITYKFIDEKIQ